jgi:5-formyltetrahydrofolate cyclo-ligase
MKTVQMDQNKDFLRTKYLNIREAMLNDEKATANKKICSIIKQHNKIIDGNNIMVYVSVSGEVDTYDIIDHLLQAGKNVYVPVVNGNEIQVSKIGRLEDLSPGRFGIPEPAFDNVNIVEPDILDVIIVPGVSFSSNGARLGRGGGYYDRFLSKISVKAAVIGICYNNQIENSIPEYENDIRVHEVITENYYSTKEE